MADFDPYDVMGADDDYEEKYADEMDMLDDFNRAGQEEIDFEKVTQIKLKSKIDLDKELFSSTSTFSTDSSNPSARNSEPLKRGCSDMESSEDELKYSDDEQKEEKQTKKSGLQPKKLKMSDSSNKAPIEFTSITANKLLKELKSRDFEQNNNNTSMSQHLTKQRVFDRPMLGVESLNVTSTDGERVYLRLHPSTEDSTNTNLNTPFWKSNRSEAGLNLLAVPFDQIFNDVMEKRHKKRIEQTFTNSSSQPTDESKTATELWVEKYHPRHYTELLSDDGTNRLLLRWLKLWDEIVFDKKPDPIKEKKTFHIKNNPIKPNEKNQSKFKSTFSNLEEELVLDKKGRPKQKIALLCGNPGLGKTTLAHVISKHAGYEVVEMNASDDRSPELFFNKIESTTQMKSVLGLSSRPNCLVIDEIDGAPSQAIKILLDIVKATEGATVTSKTKKKKKKKELVLNRPIICICNDQYVPALRQLRQVAFTLYFPPTIPSRLANRLLTISQVERLQIDMGCLLQLADKTENDIRSCLNTLQFINEQVNDAKPEDIIKMEVGQKDMKKGFRSIVGAVFRLPHSSKRSYIKQEKSSKTSASSRFYNMLHLVSGNSELDKLSQGLFDQYLHVKSKDPYLESINLATDWLEFLDFVQNQIQHTQNYVLFRYTPFFTVAFHMYFAKAASPKITYSNISYENHLTLTHNQQTLQLMQAGIHPKLRGFCSNQVCTIDIVPYLFFISLPSLRPVNTQLYSASEKQMLIDLVSVMISYNLTFRQERGPDGHYTYLLEPNIEELITYSGLPQHRHLPYATKQLIAREVELQKMRIAENMVKISNTKNTPSSKEHVVTSKDILNNQKLEPKLLQRSMGKERPQLDFFGCVIKPTPSQQKTSSKEEKKSSILYNKVSFKFNEGYTNAVRRTVKVHEML